ncbi:uncharacterized protein LOC130799794 isoform X2 [Amaranthus tricolor]|uniref:uncharacterized protein LOC130799794 isoform X2 n=1 Tax=Amaranthus tricolor TaxID=29722 RepID=UPI00258DB38A|nr:uncharacterized protein LOC130799794 isoform X2 [Amaranthus tricolor]
MTTSVSAVLGGVSALQLSKTRDAKTKCSTVVVGVSGFARSITSCSSPNHPRLSVCQTASSFSMCRLKDFHKLAIPSKRHYFVLTPCCCSASTEINPEESSIDIQLPRRRLLVQFTCGACGERTERLINRLAYERGTVFVQCAGCLQHHKLVDNLGLVVEYDFRNDNDED